MFDLVRIIVLALIIVHSIEEMVRKLREIKLEHCCSWRARLAHIIVGAAFTAPVVYYSMELEHLAYAT